MLLLAVLLASSLALSVGLHVRRPCKGVVGDERGTLVRDRKGRWAWLGLCIRGVCLLDLGVLICFVHGVPGIDRLRNKT
jgi:hypothetical protein